MSRGEKRLFFAVLAVLLAALILLGVQWVSGRDGPEIRRVSVLLDGSKGDYWQNFRAGINQAALDENVDLRFVTGYEEGATQAGALIREWQGDVDGVVVVPTDPKQLSAALESAPAGLAVTVMGPELTDARVDCYVSPDYGEMGQRLADEAVKLGGESCTLVMTPDCSAAATQIAQSFTEAMSRQGIRCDRVQTDTPETLPVPQTGAIVAVEPAMTEALCRLPALGGRICGVGTSGRLLHYLEDGVAAALVVQSDFDAGYLALTRVVAHMDGGDAEHKTVGTYTATAETMFTDPMIDILFASY